MKTYIETERLSLSGLALHDAAFIFELVNSSGWIQFIGDRNVGTAKQAENYILRIIDNQKIIYRTVRLKTDSTAIGVITLMKRDYLDDHDIGFAFLPQYAKKGYAYEAVKAVLDLALKHYPVLLATTISENKNSIALLSKLGLQYERTIKIENEKLLIYSTAKKEN